MNNHSGFREIIWLKRRKKSANMGLMKKGLLFFIFAVLVIGAIRVVTLRYQDQPEDFADVQEWIDLGKEKVEEITDHFSAQLAEKEWNIDTEGIYDIDTEEWFEEDQITYSGKSEYTKISTGTVSRLNIQTAGCQVTILPTDEEDFYCSFNNMKKVQIYQENEQLIIKAVRDTVLKEEKEKTFLNLYIPQSQELELAEMELGAGSMQVETLKAQNVDISVEAGNFVMNSLDAENITIDCAVGNLQLIMVGDVKDYNYELQCMAGNIVLDGEKHTGINEGMVIGNGAEKTMKLNCAVGNMEIGFVE